MKRLILGFFMWAAVLAALIIGNVYTIPSLAILATFLYWTISILSILLGLAVMSVSSKELSSVTTKIPFWVRVYSVVLNIALVSVLLYFHYPALAVVITIGAILGQMLITALNKAYENNITCTDK